MRREAVGRLLALTLALLGTAACGAPPRVHEPVGPVILISIDTLNPSHLGCYGHPVYTSPTIDRLAREGVLFERAFAQAPYTLPSTVSIVTGLYPQNHGVLHARHALDPKHTTLAELMRQAGYRTAAFVDGRFLAGEFGYAQGFDLYDDRSDRKNGFGFARIRPLFERWLDRQEDHRFFVFLHSYDVHHPYYPPRPYWNRYVRPVPAHVEPEPVIEFLKRTRLGQQHFPRRLYEFRSLAQMKSAYDASIRYVDDELTRIFDRLAERDYYDRALIVLLSDHGEAFFERGYQVGHGLFLYDESIRIPLVVRLPGGTHAGRRISTVVESIDVMPTVLAIAGIDPPGIPPLDGRSLAPLIETGEDTGFGWSFGLSPNTGNTWYLRGERWKYIAPLQDDPTRVVAGHIGPLDPELSVPIEKEMVERLFDLADDPGERADVGAAQPKTLAELRDRARQLLEAGTDRIESNRPLRLSRERLEALRELGYLGIDDDLSPPPETRD